MKNIRLPVKTDLETRPPPPPKPTASLRYTQCKPQPAPPAKLVGSGHLLCQVEGGEGLGPDPAGRAARAGGGRLIRWSNYRLAWSGLKLGGCAMVINDVA
jgi:hypothetical protein